MPIARHGAGTSRCAAHAPWRGSINPWRPLQVGSGPVFAPGPAGSGMDFWSIFIPGENFGRSGNLTSGDIGKR